MQEIEVRPYKQVFFKAQFKSFLESETRKLVWDFEIQTDHLISARPRDGGIVKKKKKRKKNRTFRIVDFAVQVNH